MPAQIPANVVRSPRKKRNPLVVITLIVVGVFFAIGIGKKIPTPSGTTQVKQHYNYNPALICEDAWEQKFNYADFAGDHFDVVLREGCWGGQVTLPTAWTFAMAFPSSHR